MIPLMAIMAGASLAGGIFGGIKSAEARRKQKRLLEQRKRDIDNTFNREYYQDFLEREQSKSFLSRLREQMKDANKIADNSAVVTGATNEAKIAKKSALQKNYANAVNQLAGMATAHKDRTLNWYENAKNGIYGQRQGMLDRSAQQWSNFMNNAIGASASFAGMAGGGAGGTRIAGASKGLTNAVNQGGIIKPLQTNNAFQLQGF
ncbi:MAG: hypothetical protein KGV44_09435 [Flavobacteriaceae bacterium]|nr:hypothetical protein [Flavobacteriaceae bacterium]